MQEGLGAWCNYDYDYDLVPGQMGYNFNCLLHLQEGVNKFYKYAWITTLLGGRGQQLLIPALISCSDAGERMTQKQKADR